ncbi:MAG: Dabb family protein [Actinobacteria bacterium]|nr:MAG: Dabb family protein [Actinomycetota bacterium]RIK06322.1 MAG: stress protein [Acidobacteriota bacterium]
MFRHVAMFRWTADATEQAKAAAVAGLAGLPAEIGAIREYRFGPDAGLAETNWDFAIVADFDDEAGYLTYRDHESHQRLLANVLRPVISERAAVQYTFDA